MIDEIDAADLAMETLDGAADYCMDHPLLCTEPTPKSVDALAYFMREAYRDGARAIEAFDATCESVVSNNNNNKPSDIKRNDIESSVVTPSVVGRTRTYPPRPKPIDRARESIEITKRSVRRYAALLHLAEAGLLPTFSDVSATCVVTVKHAHGIAKTHMDNASNAIAAEKTSPALRDFLNKDSDLLAPLTREDASRVRHVINFVRDALLVDLRQIVQDRLRSRLTRDDRERSLRVPIVSLDEEPDHLLRTGVTESRLETLETYPKRRLSLITLTCRNMGNRPVSIESLSVTVASGVPAYLSAYRVRVRKVLTPDADSPANALRVTLTYVAPISSTAEPLDAIGGAWVCHTLETVP